MLLQGKVAVIYGGGAIGGVVALAFAREGAKVFVADHHASSLERIAQEIKVAGNLVETARVDALEKDAVEAFVDSVAKKAGCSTFLSVLQPRTFPAASKELHFQSCPMKISRYQLLTIQNHSS